MGVFCGQQLGIREGRLGITCCQLASDEAVLPHLKQSLLGASPGGALGKAKPFNTTLNPDPISPSVRLSYTRAGSCPSAFAPASSVSRLPLPAAR